MMSMIFRSAAATFQYGRVINPWLMLPPTFDRRHGGMAYNFYIPADSSVVRINKYGPGRDPPWVPDDNATVVGSSHGWLALMNRRNNEVFLSNPITRRHIKLPPIDSLPNPELNLRCAQARVSKLILSASPDSKDCRAVASFGPHDRLAFCRPGHSHEWAPVGQLFMDLDQPRFKYAKSYQDFVFSSKSNSTVLTCLTFSDLHSRGLEDWDLTVLDSPKLVWIRAQNDEARPDDPVSSVEEHLAYAEQTDEMFLVSRFFDEAERATFGFVVSRVVKEGGGWMSTLRCSLGDMALFVGTNHSFAIPNFNPNSIYFTDSKSHQGRGDVGIYHCAPQTFSNCYYPIPNNDIIDIAAGPSPIWFTPTLT